MRLTPNNRGFGRYTEYGASQSDAYVGALPRAYTDQPCVILKEFIGISERARMTMMVMMMMMMNA